MCYDKNAPWFTNGPYQRADSSWGCGIVMNNGQYHDDGESSESREAAEIYFNCPTWRISKQAETGR